jgi:ubiquinone/menaquinone biosynthesis C-methylase UbiE
MGFYQDQIIPLLINLTMRRRDLAAYRSRVVPAADGRVLEIGIGSGLNLPFYSRNVERLIGLDPSAKLLSMARRNLRRDAPSLELIEGSAEAIPLENDSVDTVVTTWTLCSIPDADRALREMHRVLRPTGRLLFIEHGRAPEPNVRWWQDHLTPAWKRIGGGCHLNRAIQTLIEDAGFQFDRFETGYMRGLRGHRSAAVASDSLVWLLLAFPEPEQPERHELVSRNFPSRPILWPSIARW